MSPFEKPGNEGRNRREALRAIGEGALGAALSVTGGVMLGGLSQTKKFQTILDSFDPKKKYNETELVKDIKTYFKERYGVAFRIGVDRPNLSGSGVRENVFENIDFEKLKLVIDTVNFSLSQYPEGMLKSIATDYPLEISIAHKIRVSNDPSDGVTYDNPIKPNGTIISIGGLYDDWNIPEVSSTEIRYTVHHELHHYFDDTRFDFKGLKKEWEAINTEAQSTLNQTEYFNIFANLYGQTSTKEDMATFTEVLFFPSKHVSLLKYLIETESMKLTDAPVISSKRSPYQLADGAVKPDPNIPVDKTKIAAMLRKKYSLLLRFYYVLSNGQMDSKYWQKLIEEDKQK